MPRPQEPLVTLQNAAGANGNGTIVDCRGESAFVFEVTNTGVATVNFEVAFEDTDDTPVATWVAALAMRRSDGVKASTTLGNGEQWIVPVAGAGQIRARISGWASGAVTVYGRPIGDEFVEANIGQLDAGSITIGTVQQGNAGTNGQAWWVRIGDTANGPAAILTAGADALANATISLAQTALNTVFNGTTWDRIRNASADALAATGLLAAGNMLWNGTTWDRLRGANSASGTSGTGVPATGNMAYDGANWQRVQTSGDNADAQAASANGDQRVTSRLFGFNGTTWDRLRSTTTRGLQVELLGQGGATLSAAAALTDAFSPGTPMLAGAFAMGFNGATWDRVRSGGTNADALATATLGTLSTQAYNLAFNGTTWDRIRTASDAADGQSAIAAGVMAAAARGMTFNETTWDRLRGNTDVTLLASAARTTTQTSADLVNYNGRALDVVLDMTNVAASPSVTLTINYKDSASGKYILLLSGAAVTTASTNRYRVHPNLTAAANSIAQDQLPRTFQIVVTANNANSGTYSVGYRVGL